MSKTRDTLSEQQHIDRRTGLGGSDISAVLGINPWKTPLQVYYEKTGQAEGPELNERMYWGQRLEAVVADEYAARNKRDVRRRPDTIRHKKYPWLLGNIDRMVLNLDRGLECKTTSERNAGQWGEQGTDEIPNQYMAQVQHYLLVWGRPVWDVAVLIGGQEYRDYTVEADPEIRDMILEAANDFWHNNVQAGVPPAPRSIEEAAQLWPKHENIERVADAEAAEAHRRLLDVQARRKELEAQEKDLKLTMQERMGEAAVLLDQDGQNTLATWKYQEQRRLDTTAIKKDHPEIAAQYEKVSSFRKFLLK